MIKIVSENEKIKLYRSVIRILQNDIDLNTVSLNHKSSLISFLESLECFDDIDLEKLARPIAYLFINEYLNNGHAVEKIMHGSFNTIFILNNKIVYRFYTKDTKNDIVQFLKLKRIKKIEEQNQNKCIIPYQLCDYSKYLLLFEVEHEHFKVNINKDSKRIVNCYLNFLKANYLDENFVYFDIKTNNLLKNSDDKVFISDFDFDKLEVGEHLRYTSTKAITPIYKVFIKYYLNLNMNSLDQRSINYMKNLNCYLIMCECIGYMLRNKFGHIQSDLENKYMIFAPKNRINNSIHDIHGNTYLMPNKERCTIETLLTGYFDKCLDCRDLKTIDVNIQNVKKSKHESLDVIIKDDLEKQRCNSEKIGDIFNYRDKSFFEKFVVSDKFNKQVFIDKIEKYTKHVNLNLLMNKLKHYKYLKNNDPTYRLNTLAIKIFKTY